MIFDLISTNRSFSLITGVCAALSLLFGLIVLAGWHSHNILLIQVNESFAPMQYNTAVGFFLCGAGLLFTQFHLKWPGMVTGGIVFMVGILTLIQYIFLIDLGIDQLLMKHYVTTGSSHPGRMAPNTALSFMITGSFILISFFHLTEKLKITLAILASLCLTLGALAFGGYLNGLESAYGWGNLTRMAVHTSVGFILLGTCMLMHSWKISTWHGIFPKWIHIPVGIMGITVSVLFWRELNTIVDRNITSELERSTKHAVALTEQHIKARLTALERMKDRWENDRGTKKEWWLKDADNYIHDFNDLQAIGWIDSSVNARWWATSKEHKSIQNLDLFPKKSVKEAIKTAIETRKNQQTKVIVLDRDELGILDFHPIFIDNKFAGFILGVYKTSDLLKNIFSRYYRDINILIRQDGNEIFRSEVAAKNFDKDLQTYFSIQFGNQVWEGTSYPSDILTKLRRSNLSWIILVIGVIATVLLSSLIWVWRNMQVKGYNLEMANTNLRDLNIQTESKVRERTKELQKQLEIRELQNEKLDRSQETLINLMEDLKKEKDKLTIIKEKLERSNKVLEEFVYIASHDLQEPVRTMGSFIESFSKKYKGKLDSQADTHIEFITDGCLRMKCLIKDLLDYSRLGKNKTLEELDCNILIKQVRDDLKTKIEEAEAAIEVTDLPKIRGYKTEIRLLFQNLISNAIKFRRNGEAPKVLISANRENGQTIFSVQDNGIGIEKINRKKIFKLFRRLHGREEYEGTGIGLAHCKRIIDLHEGEIWVESEPNAGTTFFFSIKTK